MLEVEHGRAAEDRDLGAGGAFGEVDRVHAGVLYFWLAPRELSDSAVASVKALVRATSQI